MHLKNYLRLAVAFTTMVRKAIMQPCPQETKLYGNYDSTHYDVGIEPSWQTATAKISVIAACVDIHSSYPYLSFLRAEWTNGNNFVRDTSSNEWDHCKGLTIPADVHPIGWTPYLGGSAHISGFYLHLSNGAVWDSKAVWTIDGNCV